MSVNFCQNRFKIGVLEQCAVLFRKLYSWVSMRSYLKDGDFRHSKSNAFRGAIIVKIFGLDHGVGLFDMPQHLQNCFIQRPTSNFSKKCVVCHYCEVADFSLQWLFSGQNSIGFFLFCLYWLTTWKINKTTELFTTFTYLPSK